MGVPMMFEDRKGYAIAERMAAEALRSVDPAQAGAARSVDFDAERGVFTVPLLGSEVFVSFPDGAVIGAHDRRLSGAIAILALHYLIYRGEPLRTEGWLAYRDVPGARHFASAFEDMAENRIAGAFGGDPATLSGPAGRLGGTPSDGGDASFELPAFPRVPVLLVLWGACEGEEGSARILFKPTAPFYLHSEDLAALGAVIADWLVAVKDRGADRV
jgi:hypothetical protein